jgi:hypothetical protein
MKQVNVLHYMKKFKYLSQTYKMFIDAKEFFSQEICVLKKLLKFANIIINICIAIAVHNLITFLYSR